MSELQVSYFAPSTEGVLHQVQSALQPFVEHPERYNFAWSDVSHGLTVYGGIGTVALKYHRPRMAQVELRAEEGFAVTSSYRLYTGIWVSPVPLDDTGALEVRYQSDEGPIYRVKRWPDGGYSLRNPSGEDIDFGRIWQIGRAASSLSGAHEQSDHVQLSIVE